MLCCSDHNRSSMKGFPNQIAKIGKLAVAMQCIVELTEAGQQAKDDGIFGEALVRAGVIGPRSHIPVEQYLLEQRKKETSDQSPRATARGLRELFRLLGFINDSGDGVVVTAIGRGAAASDNLQDEQQLNLWRNAIQNMSHAGGDQEESHPYQVLLRLIARKPGIEKPKCALALEAKNDSTEELARILELARLPADKIRSRLHVSRSNFANAVKILPKFAEQLRDVVRTGRRGEYRYRIADAPGRASAGMARVPAARTTRPPAPRAPRTSRSVTPETIGQAGTVETFDEVEVRILADPAATVRARRARLRRHNLMVKKLAARLAAAHAGLFEDPFDILAIIEEIGIMVEAKTLDGTIEDERERVREALSQLLYYPAFLVSPVVNEDSINKIACFERRISNAHITWLNARNIAVIWKHGDGFAGDALAVRFLGRYLRELR